MDWIQRPYQNTMNRPTVLLALTILASLGAAVPAAADSPVTVVAEGQVSCGDASISQCREQALQEALRRAVEQGAGAFIDSSTVMQDYVVESDLVRAASRGRVVRYEVLEQGLVGETGYRYRVRAVVAPVPEPVPEANVPPMVAPAAALPSAARGNLLRNADFAAALEDGWTVEEGRLVGYRALEPLDGGLSLVYSGPGDGEAQLAVSQRIDSRYDPAYRFLARLRVDDREREGFPRLVLALMDGGGQVLARHAWTADEFYRAEDATVTQLPHGRQLEIDTAFTDLFKRTLTQEAAAAVSQIVLALEIAPPSNHSCRRCTIEVSGLSLQAP